jgi:hypothetical protein
MPVFPVALPTLGAERRQRCPVCRDAGGAPAAPLRSGRVGRRRAHARSGRKAVVVASQGRTALGVENLKGTGGSVEDASRDRRHSSPPHARRLRSASVGRGIRFGLSTCSVCGSAHEDAGRTAKGLPVTPHTLPNRAKGVVCGGGPLSRYGVPPGGPSGKHCSAVPFSCAEPLTYWPLGPDSELRNCETSARPPGAKSPWPGASADEPAPTQPAFGLFAARAVGTPRAKAVAVPSTAIADIRWDIVRLL